MHSVIETDLYDQTAKESGLSEEERLRITLYLSEHPNAGDLIPGAGGARKVRFPARGKGKSGGARVITYYSGPDIPVFLLLAYAKGDRANLSQRERNELRSILPGIAEDYRQSTREKVAEIGRTTQ